MITGKELRELDAWIAENIMGWHLEHRKLANPKGGKPTPYSTWKNARGYAELPKYTVDKALAMEVLEKLPYGRIISILYNNQIWTVDNLRGAAPWEEKEIHAETLPLAICLFAKEIFSNKTKI